MLTLITLKLLLIWSSCISIYLVAALTDSDLIARYCSDDSDYTYRRNVDTTLSGLPRTNFGFGFFNLSTGQGNDTVYAVALCQGDVNLDVCRSCLNDCEDKLLSVCRNNKEAIAYCYKCFLRYSNQPILHQTVIMNNSVFDTNNQNTSDIHRFNEALGSLLDNLRQKAADGSPLLKFATGNTSGPGFSTIYALVQCTPDLSKTQCNDCLEDSTNRMYRLNWKSGGSSHSPACNFRYETYKFFNDTIDIDS